MKILSSVMILQMIMILMIFLRYWFNFKILIQNTIYFINNRYIKQIILEIDKSLNIFNCKIFNPIPLSWLIFENIGFFPDPFPLKFKFIFFYFFFFFFFFF